ncbi:lactate utilization protein [Litorilinea aerophila]|uniref:LUD domain-containing protein n=1 Tax=Litorilinea aerophila TaxID=1204385 RepID=A0A540VEL7_9CHLR|nr:lactate utilization protein [Litorilinea aerophila]MCC9077145.1 lactate utilization protein [Litorilinea aerophila]
MEARDEILGKLRQTLARPDLRFPPARVEPLTPETRMTVTSASGTQVELAHRFGQELEKLHGSYQVVETAPEARLALINRLLAWMEEEKLQRKGAVVVTGQERSVLAWDPASLPIPGLDVALADMEIQLVAPRALLTAESREAVRAIRYGITGVEAAFASTGSMLVASGAGTSRAASLLPLRHIALIPFDRLYPTMEDWLAEEREAHHLVDYVRSHANLALITGPSKSADIEMNLTLGVHGPKFVHAILFDRTARSQRQPVVSLTEEEAEDEPARTKSRPGFDVEIPMPPTRQ